MVFQRYVLLMALMLPMAGYGQVFTFPSTNISPGATTCITVNANVGPPVYGLGDPILGPFPTSFVSQVCINIQTSHPWTLNVFLIHMGDTLTLTAFNGAGGSNYTNTCFGWYAGNPITSGSPPFTGYFDPQQNPPGFSIYNGSGPGGIWQLCIQDTLTDTTTVTPGPPGLGATSVGGGTIAIGFACPPCGPTNTSASGSMCPGGTFDLGSLIPSPPPSLVEYYDATWTPISQVVTSPGSYNIIMVDACDPIFPCTTFVAVTIYAAPVPNLGPDQSIDACPGVPVNLPLLFPLAGLSQSWTHNGIGITAAAAAAATLPGTYQLIGTNSSLCNDTAVVVVNHFIPPALGPDQTFIGCTVAPFNLTTVFNTTGLTTVWTLNGNPVANLSAVVVNGNYMLVATDANGCRDTAMLQLSLSVSPNLGPDQNQTVCDGTPVNLTTLYTTSGLTPSWTYQGSPVLNPTAVTQAGVYTLVATNANGCPDTALVTVSVNSAPVLGASQSMNFCSNTTVDLTTIYNTTGLTATWSLNGGPPVSNPSSVTTAGVYTITATNAAGCSSQATVTLSTLQAPDLGPDQNAFICPGAVVDLTSIYTNTGWTGSWTLNGNQVVNPNSVNQPGIYQLVATAPNGCSDQALVTVANSPAPNLGPDQTVTGCSNPGVNLQNIFNTSGTTPSWTYNGVPVGNTASVTLSGTYILIATNSSGCSDTAQVQVTVVVAPDLGPDAQSEFCQGISVNLNSFFNLTGLQIQWTLNGIPVSNPAIVAATGNYQVVASNGTGCTDTAVVMVNVFPNPDPGPNQNFQLCPWMTVDMTTIFNTTGFTSYWQVDGMTYTPITNENNPGLYQVTVIDANGCEGVANATITNIPCECEADFVFTGDCMKEPVSFSIIADSAIVSAHWIFGNGMPDSYQTEPVVQFSTENPVMVILEVTLTCGIKTIEKEVDLEDCSSRCRFYIPNAFTPNRDGTNEKFFAMSECLPLEYAMEIRNRFGQVVFSTGNMYEAWNGTYEGMASPEGIYVYHIRYKMPYQSRKFTTGRVSLIR
jgi:gliding motility-associated-like protein